MPGFTKFPRAQQHCMQISCTEFYPNHTINVESRNRCLFTAPLNRVWLSWRQFSQNSQLFGDIVCEDFPYQISRESVKSIESKGKNSFVPSNKVWLFFSWFSRNSCLLDNVLLSHWKCDIWFGCWYCIMDRWMWSPHKTFFPFFTSERTPNNLCKLYACVHDPFFIDGEKGKTDNLVHNSIPTVFPCDMELLTIVQAPAS